MGIEDLSRFLNGGQRMVRIAETTVLPNFTFGFEGYDDHHVALNIDVEIGMTLTPDGPVPMIRRYQLIWGETGLGTLIRRLNEITEEVDDGVEGQ